MRDISYDESFNTLCGIAPGDAQRFDDGRRGMGLHHTLSRGVHESAFSSARRRRRCSFVMPGRGANSLHCGVP